MSRVDTLRLTRRLRKLFVPVISDTLDEIGLTHNAFSPDIRPIIPKAKIAGIALPARTGWYDDYRKVDLGESVEVMVRMLDDTKPGDIFVVSTGGRLEASVWGELMSNAAQVRGALGAVLDGTTRDVPRILSMRSPFPVFAKGFNPADAVGRLTYTEYNAPVECGGVKVEPGDIIFADFDGVVCIPRKDAEKIIQRSEERIAKEDGFRRAIKKGMSVTAAFAKYKTF